MKISQYLSQTEIGNIHMVSKIFDLQNDKNLGAHRFYSNFTYQNIFRFEIEMNHLRVAGMHVYQSLSHLDHDVHLSLKFLSKFPEVISLCKGILTEGYDLSRIPFA